MHIGKSAACKKAWSADLSSMGPTVHSSSLPSSLQATGSDFSGSDYVTIDAEYPSKPTCLDEPCTGDEDNRIIHPLAARCVEGYPRPAGIPVSTIKEKTKFERLYQEHNEAGITHFLPFRDQDDWELAKWLNKNVGQKATDDFLKLNIVSKLCC